MRASFRGFYYLNGVGEDKGIEGMEERYHNAESYRRFNLVSK